MSNSAAPFLVDFTSWLAAHGSLRPFLMAFFGHSQFLRMAIQAHLPALFDHLLEGARVIAPTYYPRRVGAYLSVTDLCWDDC